MNYQSNPILTPKPSDVEVITVPRERTFWQMLLGAPDGTLLDVRPRCSTSAVPP